MDRKYFLASTGLSAATFALINCAGCAKSSSSPSTDTSGPTGIDFTPDLSLSANSVLNTSGGYLVSNGVIVARTSSGTYLAVQRSCTHESYSLIYQASANRFYCANHGATFSESGTVTNGPASRTLTIPNSPAHH
ncbi:MAG: Rieske 2Fe-2S domain-containing protein [Sediminibacterium sp.]